MPMEGAETKTPSTSRREARLRDHDEEQSLLVTQPGGTVWMNYDPDATIKDVARARRLMRYRYR
jgi:hypothetical protein